MTESGIRSDTFRLAVMEMSTRNRIAWGLLLVFSIVLHLWQLDVRTFHSDEAVHARLAYDLYANGYYRYDPTYHGPLLYFLTAAIYGLFGDSDFTARLGIAAAGVGMLWIAWRLRRPFGGRAAWWAGLLVTISPLCLYYGRFLRMDLLEMLTASAALLSLYAVLRPPTGTGQWKWVGIWGALAIATKENAYVTLLLLAITLILVALVFGFRRCCSATGRRAVEQWRGLVTALAWFALCALALYTAFFQHPGDWDFPAKAIRHWALQHAEERVGGPWWYYLLPLVQYEFLILSAAMVWVARRPRLRPVEVGLFLFGAASIIMYAYLGEKVVWLGVHQVWAFIPLAAAQLARTFGPEGVWWSRVVAVTGLTLTVIAAVAANFVLEEISPAHTRAESLHYVQTSPEMNTVVDDIREQTAHGENPAALVIGEATWPLAWYLRHDPVHWSITEESIKPPIVVVDPEQVDSVCSGVCSDPTYEREAVPLRSWWLPQQAVPGVGELLRYQLARKPWVPIATKEVLVLRKQLPVQNGS
jgi:uncharacterized protein (TIGR03663 family)